MVRAETDLSDADSSSLRVRMRRLVHFALAGVLATLAHYLVMFTGLALTGGPIVWSFIGATVGSAVGYLVNYFITFKSTVPHGRALSRYATIVVTSIGLNTLTIFVLLEFTDMRVLFAQIISTAFVFFANYFAHSNITFKG